MPGSGHRARGFCLTAPSGVSAATRAGLVLNLPRMGELRSGRYAMAIDPDSSGPTSRIYFSQRLRLHYVDWGNPTAPPLLLVHGGRDHCRNWDWVATALRRDWHVLAPDLRGHGDSQWSPDGNYSTSAYIYDLDQLIHQQELAPVTIVAHSLGGNIAIRYTGVFPEKVRTARRDRGARADPEADGGALGGTDRRPDAEMDRRAARPVRPHAAALCLDRGGAETDAGSQPPSVARAGAPLDAIRRQPERGRHL